jgi:hypothetical protein
MISMTLAAQSLAALSFVAMPPCNRAHGETPPKGPPWHVTYRAAKRDAIRNGRPVFVYFTKTV